MKVHRPLSQSQQKWSGSELRTCVEAYYALWAAEAAGASLNKTSIRNSVLASSLTGRSKGSYEYRMQNISAVLDDLGEPIIAGYLPRRNIGSAKLTIIDLINEFWQRAAPEKSTADGDALNTRVMSARRRWTADRPPPPGNSSPSRKAATSGAFVRDPEVVAWTLVNSKGICEASGEPAPFTTSAGIPFLEVHHLRFLAEGGPDTIDNAIACCPNCHKRLHFGADAGRLRRLIIARTPRLIDWPRLPAGFGLEQSTS